METLAKLRCQLDYVADRLKAASKTWSRHLEDVRKDWAILEKQHPYALKQNAWATPQACTAALVRLGAILEHVHGPTDTLCSYGIRRNRQESLDFLLRVFVTKKPIGPETHAWQVICGILETQNFMDGYRSAIGTTEMKMTKKLEILAKLHRGLTKFAKSKEIKELAKLQDWEREVESCRESDDMEFPEAGGYEVGFWLTNREFEEMATCVERSRRMMEKSGLPKLEAKINFLTAMMARDGIWMARQKLITEYFRRI